MAYAKKLLRLGFGALISGTLASGVSLFSSLALAQSTPGTKLEVVMRSGEQHKIFTFSWQGISTTDVFGERPELFKRADVRIVCADVCPRPLPTGDVNADTVTWRTGQPTAGPVTGVGCTEYDVCRMYQDGHSRDWYEVRFIQFAPR